jgi:hypothetical protein
MDRRIECGEWKKGKIDDDDDDDEFASEGGMKTSRGGRDQSLKNAAVYRFGPGTGAWEFAMDSGNYKMRRRGRKSIWGSPPLLCS